MDIQKPNFKKKPSFLIATFECTFTQLHQCKVAKKSQHYYIIYLIKAFQQVSLSLTLCISPSAKHLLHSFKQLSELFIVAILFTFVCEKGEGFCALEPHAKWMSPRLKNLVWSQKRTNPHSYLMSDFARLACRGAGLDGTIGYFFILHVVFHD